MPDIFDSVAEKKTDIFDSLTPQQDVFDQIKPESAVQERMTSQEAPLSVRIQSALSAPEMTLQEMARTGQTRREGSDVTAGTPENTPPQPTALKKEYLPQYWYGKGVQKVAEKLPEGKVKSALEFVGGANESLAEQVSGMTSAPNLAMLAIAPEGKVAQRVIQGVFLGQAIKATPEEWKALKQSAKDGDWATAGKIVGSLGGSYAAPLLPEVIGRMKEGKAEPVEAPKPPVEPPPVQPAVPPLAIKQTPSGPMLEGAQGVSVKPQVDPQAVAEASVESQKAIAQTQPIGVAERYVEAEQPGTVIPGTREDAQFWRQKGRDYINQGGDLRMPIRAAQAGHVSPRNVGIVSAEHERLTEIKRQAADALEIDPNNPVLQKNFKDTSDAWQAWRREMQPVLTRAGEALGAAIGEQPFDLGTFDGLHSKAMELNGGKELTSSQKTGLIRRASVVRKARVQEAQAVDRLGKEIDRTLPKRLTPTREEMLNIIENKVRQLTPC